MDNGGISSVNGIVVSFTNNVVVSSNDVGDAGDGGGDNTKKNIRSHRNMTASEKTITPNSSYLSRSDTSLSPEWQ